MKTKIFAFVLVTALILSLFTGCGEEPPKTSVITRLSMGTLSKTTFVEGETSTPFELHFSAEGDFNAEDVVPVISNPLAIDVKVEKDTSTVVPKLIFKITALQAGKSTLYFETADKMNRTDYEEITVVSNISDISFSDASNLVIYLSSSPGYRYFSIKNVNPVTDITKSLDFMTDNQKVATIRYDNSDVNHKCVITPVGLGETYIYVQTKDGSCQSEKIKVIVKNKNGSDNKNSSDKTSDHS